MYYDRTAFHFVQRGTGSTESLSQMASFKASIQPASDQVIAILGATYGRTFTVFTSYSGLNVGDSITLSGTATVSGSYYNVRGMRQYPSGPLPHFEATVVQPEV